MFNSDIILREAHHVMCVLLAEKTVYQMTDTDERIWGGPRPSREALFTLKLNFIEDEIIHGIVNLASFNRVQLDFLIENNKKTPQKTCGSLIQDFDNSEKSELLSFRDACNKIIHAQRWELTFEKDGIIAPLDVKQIEPIHHEVWLKGNFFEKNWLAKVDIFDFIRATVENFEMHNRPCS